MIKKLISLLVCLPAFFCVGYAQHIDHAGATDANKAGSGKSVADIISVNLFTGRATATVPIHSFSRNGINAGVALIYDASGVKVNDVSSSIGLGWDIAAGGSVTREIYGIEDEVTLPKTFYNRSYDSVQGYLVPGATIDTNYINPWDDDKERDKFMFNLCGRNISVVFGYNPYSGALIYQTYPYSNITIQAFTKDISLAGTDSNVRSGIGRKCGIDLRHDILTFVVQDETGNKFYFDRGDQIVKNVEFSFDTLDNDTTTYYPIQKWDLVKIETYSGLVIKYDYIRKWVDYVENQEEVLTTRHEMVGSGVTFYDPLEIRQKYWRGYKSHLSKITYPNGVDVVFDLDTSVEARCDCKKNFRVKNIIVDNNYDGKVFNSLTYELQQSFFNTPADGLTGGNVSIPPSCSTIKGLMTSGLSDSIKELHLSRGLRLKLNAIVRKKRTGVSTYRTEPYFSFDYNATTLPFRFDPQQDFYGYYNGKASSPYIRTNLHGAGNDTLYLSIPYHHDTLSGYTNAVTIYTPYWGAHREHDFEKAKAASLVKVSNCGGGEISLEYKDYHLVNPVHSYDSLYLLGPTVHGEDERYNLGYGIDTALQGDTVNDGLVIGKITTSDGYSIQNKTSVEYNYDSAQRFNRGGYTWYYTYRDSMMLTNFFVCPLSFVDGSNHGFGYIAVTTKGYAGQQITKDVYTYTNLMYIDGSGKYKSWMRKPTGKYFHTTPGDFKQYAIGLPLKSEHYDNNNTLISRSANTYEYNIPSNGDIMSSKYYYGTYWKYHIMDHELMRVKTSSDTAYLSTKKMVQTEEYTYDAYNNLKRTVATDSKGDTFKNYTYYNYDYYSSPASLATITMTNNHMFVPLGAEQWKMKSGDSVLTAYSLTAPQVDTNLNARLHMSGASFRTILNTPLSSGNAANTSYIDRNTALNYKIYPNNSVGANLYKTSENTLYDTASNVIETKVNNQYYKSTIWDYRRGDKLAEVSNARYRDIAYTSFESAYSNYGTSDYNKGNWDFNPSNIVYCGDVSMTSSITGKYFYDLFYHTLSGKPLQHQKYLLTFWLNSSLPSVGVSLTNGSSYNAITYTLKNTVGNWKLYSAIIEPDSGWKVLFTGATSGNPGEEHEYLDEVRLHPLGAVMNSYTYTPLCGVNSINNPNNYITYDEYDPLNRLSITRDLRGYILKKYEIVCNGTDKDSGDPNNGDPGGNGND